MCRAIMETKTTLTCEAVEVIAFDVLGMMADLAALVCHFLRYEFVPERSDKIFVVLVVL